MIDRINNPKHCSCNCCNISNKDVEDTPFYTFIVGSMVGVRMQLTLCYDCYKEFSEKIDI